MTSTLSLAAEQFVQSVLDLNPRVVAFDCDGTLWYGDAGMKFFYWEIEEGLVPKDVAERMLHRYDEYLACMVTEDEMCGEMVAMHKGIGVEEIERYASKFVDSNVMPHVFPEMRVVVERLRERGTDIWAVSSTNNWVIEDAVAKLGIPKQRVLAVRVEVENGVATDRLSDITSGPGKARALQAALSTPLDASFGNSIFDREMLELARAPYAINPSPDLRVLAEHRGWRIYQPATP